MWAPSTPLKLPGKKTSDNNDVVSRYILETDVYGNEQDDNDEAVLFTRNS